YCFFFSSSRRHTISKRDWSSDVCSSDLICFISAILSVGPAVAVRLWNASVRYVTLLPPTPHQFLTESWIRSSTALRQIFLAHPVGRWLERAHISFLQLPSSRRGLLPGNLGWCPIM